MSGYELSPSNTVCPACEGPLAPDAVICTHCGLNLTTGRKVTDPAPRPAALEKPKAGLVCGRCGYDLRGLGGEQCPECGQTAEGRRKGGKHGFREERRAEEIEGYWKKTKMIGGIGLAVGVALTAGVGLGMIHWSVAACAVHLAVCIAAVIVSSLALGFFFIGFEEDLRGLCLRSVGIGAVWAGLWAAALVLPSVPYYSQVFMGMVHAAIAVVLVRTFTGRDWDDSCWIGGIAWVLRFVPWIVLTQVLWQ